MKKLSNMSNINKDKLVTFMKKLYSEKEGICDPLYGDFTRSFKEWTDHIALYYDDENGSSRNFIIPKTEEARDKYSPIAKVLDVDWQLFLIKE